MTDASYKALSSAAPSQRLLAVPEALPETGSGALLKAVLEVSPCFLLAGMGMVASGALLDYTTENMQVFQACPALIILVPALLGLKGNLEMTLGARLGSHANQKELEGETFWPIVKSNLMAIQGQAIIVGFFASALATAENYVKSGWNTTHVLLLFSSSITSASLASLVLSLLMIAIVVCASRRGVDPDNISAPIAGTLGDFCTLSIVVLVAKGFWALPESVFFMVLPSILCVYPFVAVACCRGAYRSKYSEEIMKYGWYPILASMLLSNLSGPISQASIEKFKRFALFQVVMNGAGGNLGAIYAAKLSTDLAITKAEMEGTLDDFVEKPPNLPAKFRSLSRSFSTMAMTKADDLAADRADRADRADHAGRRKVDAHMRVANSWISLEGGSHSHFDDWLSVAALTKSGDMGRFSRMLFILIIPGQLLFSCVVVGKKTGFTALPTPLFLVCFITASLGQVCILMMAARSLVVAFWKRHVDPDNAASPLICGLGDLCGTTLMALAFHVVDQCGAQVWPGGGL